MTTSRLLDKLRHLHQHIRDQVLLACERQSQQELARLASQQRDDFQYAIDRISEGEILAFIEREIASEVPVVVIFEGLEQDAVVLPHGGEESGARWRIIIDPIDGTRGLMYQKRSGWILTGVAANNGAETTLQDIFLALQSEIPPVKQHLCDQLWAIQGKGAFARRYNRLSSTETELPIHPSNAKTIEHGFVTFTRFFPGGQSRIAAIEDHVLSAVLGTTAKNRELCFEDQYISTGGQLYGLIMGSDRFVADLRPLVGKTAGLCCHPYDICTELIAREAGVIITDERGEPLSAPLDTTSEITWLGYANEHIRRQIEPHLLQAISA